MSYSIWYRLLQCENDNNKLVLWNYETNLYTNEINNKKNGEDEINERQLDI